VFTVIGADKSLNSRIVKLCACFDSYGECQGHSDNLKVETVWFWYTNSVAYSYISIVLLKLVGSLSRFAVIIGLWVSDGLIKTSVASSINNHFFQRIKNPERYPAFHTR
jgi:hypothetical protein